MDKKELEELVKSFNVVKQVCNDAQGNLQFHNTVQYALNVISEKLNEQLGQEEVNASSSKLRGI